MKDRIINVPVYESDVLNTLKSLPQTPLEAGVIPVKMKRKVQYKNAHKCQYVSVPKIMKTLSRLKKIGNKYYQFIPEDILTEEYEDRFMQMCQDNDINGFKFLYPKGVMPEMPDDDDGNFDDVNLVQSGHIGAGGGGDYGDDDNEEDVCAAGAAYPQPSDFEHSDSDVSEFLGFSDVESNEHDNTNDGNDGNDCCEGVNKDGVAPQVESVNCGGYVDCGMEINQYGVDVKNVDICTDLVNNIPITVGDLSDNLDSVDFVREEVREVDNTDGEDLANNVNNVQNAPIATDVQEEEEEMKKR